MTRWALLLLAFLALALARPAAAQSPAPEDYRLEIVPDPRQTTPLAGEMILLTVRGVYGHDIALEDLPTPHLEAFGWLRLAPDAWTNQDIDGRRRRVFERRMALFADHAGRLALPPFRHNLTLANRDGRRFAWPVASAPIEIEVAPAPGGGGWWLPARRVSLEESWQGDPTRVSVGEPVVWTVTLTAEGLTPDRLPPMPEVRTSAIFAFPEPEARTLDLTPDGPIARVTWRWALVPETPRGAVLGELRIPWFDTTAREAREAVLPARVFQVDAAVLGLETRDPRLEALAPAAALAGALGGALAGLALLAPGLARRRGLVPRPPRALARALDRLRLARALRRGDVHAARWIAHRLGPGAAGEGVSDRAAALAALDRIAYGPPGAGAPPLAELSRRLRARARA